MASSSADSAGGVCSSSSMEESRRPSGAPGDFVELEARLRFLRRSLYFVCGDARLIVPIISAWAHM